VLDWTASSPALPFVTSRHTSEETLQVIRGALTEIFADTEFSRVRQVLLLEGVSLQPDVACARVLELERAAVLQRYPTLL